MAEHSPLPWEYRPHRHDDWGWIRGPKAEGDEIGPLVALARSGSWHSEKYFDEHRRNKTDPYAANAAFIVKAVNNHEEAVEIIESLLGLELGSGERALAFLDRVKGGPNHG